MKTSAIIAQQSPEPRLIIPMDRLAEFGILGALLILAAPKLWSWFTQKENQETELLNRLLTELVNSHKTLSVEISSEIKDLTRSISQLTTNTQSLVLAVRQLEIHHLGTSEKLVRIENQLEQVKMGEAMIDRKLDATHKRLDEGVSVKLPD